MKELLKDILPLLNEAEELRPVVEKVFKILKSYGPELRDLFDGMADYTIDRRIASIKRLEEAGFSREDAMNITMDEWYVFVRSARNRSRSKS